MGPAYTSIGVVENGGKGPKTGCGSWQTLVDRPTWWTGAPGFDLSPYGSRFLAPGGPRLQVNFDEFPDAP